MAMDITFYFIHIHYAARCIHVKWQLGIAALHATYQPVVTSYFHNGDHRIKIRQYFVRSMHVYVYNTCMWKEVLHMHKGVHFFCKLYIQILLQNNIQWVST